jgi:vitamin B12 transporter
MTFFMALVLCAFSLHAATYTLPEIRVTAQKDPPLCSQTLITEKNLAAHQQKTAVEALQGVPGVHMVQSTEGHVASLFVRGGNSDHVLVTLDGMPVNNPSTPNGVYDFGQLDVTGQNIKILRGPHSAQYGTGAIAGVIDITTPRATGAAKAALATEIGIANTYQNSLSLKSAPKNGDFSLDFHQLNTQSPSTTPENKRVTQREWGKETHKRQAFSSRVGYTFHSNWRVNFWNRYQHFETHYPNIYLNNPSAMDQGNFWLHRLQVEGQQGFWKPTASIGHVTQEHTSLNDQAPYLENRENLGKTTRLDQTNTFRLTSFYTLHLNMAQEQEKYTLHEQKQLKQQAKSHTNEWATGHTLTPVENLKIEGWVRFHQPDRFKKATSYRTSVSYEQKKTLYFASLAKAIKTPSLRQLYDPTSGNQQLMPETNHGWDVGIQQTLGSWKIGITYFSNTLDHMIENHLVKPDQFTYINIRKARTYGTETFAQWNLKDWTLRLDHTFLHAKDQTNNTQLLRRPMHKVGFQADYVITEKWHMGTGLIFYGKQADMNRYTPFNRVYPGSTTLVRVFTRYDMNEHCQWFARIENALSRPHEMPAGYLQPRFSAFTGIKLTT